MPAPGGLSPRQLRIPAFGRWRRLAGAAALAALMGVAPAGACAAVVGPLRAQAFNADPGWQGVHNRLRGLGCRTTSQAFGFSQTRFTSPTGAEIGGRIWNSYTQAYYAKVLARPFTLSNVLSASGTLMIARGSARSGGIRPLNAGALFGFFNSASRDWRTPNSLVFRFEEKLPGRFAIGPEYGTRTYRASGQWLVPRPGHGYLRTGSRYRWSLRYDPAAAAGRGRISFSIAGVGTTALILGPGHRRQGAVFDRFGLLNRMLEGNDVTAYFGDLTLNGVRQRPAPAGGGWEGRGNQASFLDCLLDNRQDFGYTAGGAPGVPAGAIGGVVWRTEANRPGFSAYYADRVGPLNLNRPIYAAGTVQLVRASSDSAVNFGFFRAGSGGAGDKAPRNFVGVGTDGPSRVGFYFRPVFRSSRGRVRRPDVGPTIMPNGAVHRWTLRWVPRASGGGVITATLDGRASSQLIPPADRAAGATLDRFGIRNVTVGGHAQVIYLDNLRYST
jgi:hypothetical protein